jgi:ribonuclease D
VDDAAGVVSVAEALGRSPLVAFDLEFDSRETRVPVLCLVQVAWLPELVSGKPSAGSWDALDAAMVAAICATPPAIALVDPLAAGCDVAPIIAALAAHPRVIAHAPRQDLGIVAARFGDARAAMAGLVDTQLMAAFAGLGEQVGLAGLANELLGVALDKDQQFTKWQQRPLSDKQLAYAADDVRYLPALYGKLAVRLGPRLPWARAETAVVAADAIAAMSPDPDEAWRDVGPLRGLDADALGAVAAVAAWRVRKAVELDMPLGKVLSDKAILALARERPDSEHLVGEARGKYAAEIAAAIAAATPMPIARHRGSSPRAQRWTDVLLVIAQLVAEQAGLATRLLATRSEAEAFARAVDEHGLAGAADLPALATWRRELVGVAWEGFLTGHTVLTGDAGAPGGLALLPR